MATKALTVTEHDSNETDRNFWVSTTVLCVWQTMWESVLMVHKNTAKKGFQWILYFVCWVK